MSRLIKIVCTLGPSTSSYESINSLASAGMDFARLNFSHGTYDEHKKMIDIVKKISAKKKHIKILQDLPGPKIRVDKINGRVLLKEGSEIMLADKKSRTKGAIPINFDEFSSAVSPNSTILLCDGTIKLKTDKIKGAVVYCTVESGGILTSHKGVNILGTTSDIGSITAEDITHIKSA